MPKKNPLFRALAALLGLNDVHGPTKRTVTALDVYEDGDGYIHLSNVRMTPSDAYLISLELLRRLK
jgi:hypothetical protein